MKKIYATLLSAVLLALGFATSATAQSARPGKTNSNTTAATTRPGSSTIRPGSTTGKQPAAKPSTAATRPGTSSGVARPGTTSRPGSTTTTTTKRPGTSTVARPGTSARPATLTPPSRPDRLPAVLRPATPRPAAYHSSITFRSPLFGLTLGTALSNSLDYLYNSRYSVDGYNTNEIYLRNVYEFGYTWTDATLFYQNGQMTGSMLYDSTISDNTARYYSVFNQLSSLYGRPVASNQANRNLNATWWSSTGEYITLEYTLQRSTNGYRFFTILSTGR
ncbi:MAG: hypothetical protein K2G01_02395 [Paramuribaculum sp.]|nr:hypothetical protein [Paramuribaculum sp.]